MLNAVMLSVVGPQWVTEKYTSFLCRVSTERKFFFAQALGIKAITHFSLSLTLTLCHNKLVGFLPKMFFGLV